jgi:hypothetical protein
MPELPELAVMVIATSQTMKAIDRNIDVIITPKRGLILTNSMTPTLYCRLIMVMRMISVATHHGSLD